MTASRVTEESVLADLQFLVPSNERPRVYAFDPPDGSARIAATFTAQRVTIRSARPIARDLSLDEQGFVLALHHSSVRDFYEEADLRATYYREVEELVRSVTGASKVVAFDHNVRVLDGRRKGSAPVYGAVLRAHNDYTARSGLERAQQVLSLDLGGDLAKRAAIINAWRPIREPVLHAPLAVCDARSVAASHLVATDIVYSERSGEIYYVAYGADQAWYYFPRLMCHEVLLIKVFDTQESGARFTPHGAFEDRTAPLDALPRESIEVRTVALFH
jgi:hypothetical protein